MVAPRPSELALAIGILEGRYSAPEHLVQGPTHHADGGGDGEDHVHTQAEIPASTIALSAPGLRRTESVVAHMASLRTPEPVRQVSNFFAAVGSFVLEDVPAKLLLFRSPARRVRRRTSALGLVTAPFEYLARLDGPSKIMLVAAPYVLALAVAALLLERQHHEASLPIALAPTVAAAAPVPAPVALGLAPAVTPEASPRDTSPPQPPEPGLERRSLSLEWPVRLAPRPGAKSTKGGLVPAGTSIELLLGLEIEPGWALVRVPETGAVGYFPASQLERAPDAPSEPRESRRQKKRRRARHR